MNWLEGKIGLILAIGTMVATLAGFGYEGARTINRIDNIESSVEEYKSLSSQMIELEKSLVSIEEQLKSLDIPDISAIKEDIVKIETDLDNIEIPDITILQTSIAGINSSIDSMYDDIQTLKNKNANPLAQ
tara:strand:- start:9 stop:401 length:393 start_codon:yes stop_codon:yes gene_type:complete